MKVAALKEVTYDPSVYLNVETVGEAVSVILTPEEGMSSEHRWKHEAPYLMTLIEKHCEPKSLVFDYGCGIGRLAKPLIEMLQCSVIGVDISPAMRGLAASLVDSHRFFALPPEMLCWLEPSQCDFALAVWTLQHCLNLSMEVDRIRNALKKGGKLFVLNNEGRALPMNDGRWVDDGLDVRNVLTEKFRFEEIESGRIEDESIAPNWLKKQTFWAVYQK